MITWAMSLASRSSQGGIWETNNKSALLSLESWEQLVVDFKGFPQANF